MIEKQEHMFDIKKLKWNEVVENVEYVYIRPIIESKGQEWAKFSFIASVFDGEFVEFGGVTDRVVFSGDNFVVDYDVAWGYMRIQNNNLFSISSCGLYTALLENKGEMK